MTKIKNKNLIKQNNSRQEERTLQQQSKIKLNYIKFHLIKKIINLVEAYA